MSTEVRQMFSSIATKYDVTNEVLSFGIHRLWRRATVRLSGAKEGNAVLDCATGTGDLALAFKRKVGASGRVMGTDFCKEMLDNAKEGEITEVTYVWPRPNATDPEEKISFVTKVNGQVCGVGYYTK